MPKKKKQKTPLGRGVSRSVSTEKTRNSRAKEPHGERVRERSPEYTAQQNRQTHEQTGPHVEKQKNLELTTTNTEHRTLNPAMLAHKTSIVQQYTHTLKELLENVQRDGALKYLRQLPDNGRRNGDDAYWDVFTRYGTFLNDESASRHTSDLIGEMAFQWRERPLEVEGNPGEREDIPQEFLRLSKITPQQYRAKDKEKYRSNAHAALVQLFQDSQKRNPRKEYAVPNPILIEELINILGEKCSGRFLNETATAIGSTLISLDSADHREERRNKQKVMVTCTSRDKINVSVSRSIYQSVIESHVEAKISYDVTAVNGLISYQNCYAKVTLPVAPSILTELKKLETAHASGARQQAPLVTYKTDELILEAPIPGGAFTVASMLEEVPHISGSSVEAQPRAYSTQHGGTSTSATPTISARSIPQSASVSTNVAAQRSAGGARSSSTVSSSVPPTRSTSGTSRTGISNVRDSYARAPYRLDNTSTAVENVRSTVPSRTAPANAREGTSVPVAQQEHASGSGSRCEESSSSSTEQTHSNSLWARIRNFFVAAFRSIKKFFGSIKLRREPSPYAAMDDPRYGNTVRALLQQARERHAQRSSHTTQGASTQPSSHTSSIDVGQVIPNAAARSRGRY